MAKAKPQPKKRKAEQASVGLQRPKRANAGKQSGDKCGLQDSLQELTKRQPRVAKQRRPPVAHRVEDLLEADVREHNGKPTKWYLVKWKVPSPSKRIPNESYEPSWEPREYIYDNPELASKMVVLDTQYAARLQAKLSAVL